MGLGGWWSSGIWTLEKIHLHSFLPVSRTKSNLPLVWHDAWVYFIIYDASKLSHNIACDVYDYIGYILGT